MDGLEALIQDLEAINKTKPVRTSSHSSRDSENDSKKNEFHSEKFSHTSLISDENIEIICSQIKGLLMGISDEAVREKINAQLSKLKYDSFIEYYSKDSSLAEYTINTELQRMDFKIIYNDDIFIRKDDIVRIYHETSNHILWRLANQSIYAELILSLQNNFPIEELNLSVSSNKSSFILDFDSQALISESTFSFQSINHSMAAHSHEKKLFELADIRGVIQVFLKERKVFQQFHSPSLRILFDDRLREIAENIALLQSAAMDESNDDMGFGSLPNSLLSIRDFLMFGAEKQGLDLGQKALSAGNGFLEKMVMSVGFLLGADKHSDTASFDFPSRFPRADELSGNREDFDDAPTVSIEEYLGGSMSDSLADVSNNGDIDITQQSDSSAVVAFDDPLAILNNKRYYNPEEDDDNDAEARGGEDIYCEEEDEIDNQRNPAKTSTHQDEEDWDDWD